MPILQRDGAEIHYEEYGLRDLILLFAPGDDTPHPAVVGQELAAILPGAECLNDWKSPAHIDTQREQVVAFLKRHAP